MQHSNVLRVFPNDPVPPAVDHADGYKIYTKDGREILDVTGGGTSYCILGWNNSDVNEAIQRQLSKFTHIDYKIWTDENVEELASLLVSRSECGLDRVYFCGNSGAEACETAMKLSYQRHCIEGNTAKKWFISRTQSYHGSTADALALGERPNLEFYRHMLSPYRERIPMHHPLYNRKADESLDDYARRSAKELEDKILEIGASNVAGFVGETIMGGLVGDVPPAPNYWRYIREVCDRHNVHLILDEVYCGTGTSGKIFCCDWDGVKPDFLFIGKTLAAGYSALSCVLTSKEYEDVIRNGGGRIQHTSTHQGLSIGVAAALAVQKIVHDDAFLKHVRELGEYMRGYIRDALGGHEFFRDVRGRGLRFSFEYKTPDNDSFSADMFEQMLEKHAIYSSIKFHRVCFTPALTLTRADAEQVLEKLVDVFHDAAGRF